MSGRRGGDRDGPTRIGELVDAFLEKKGVRSQVRRMGVLEEWDALVGEAIARVARPRSLSEGTLFVEVRSSAWLMELNMVKGDVLRRLNDGRDEEVRVDRIVFVLGDGGGEEPGAGGPRGAEGTR